MARHVLLLDLKDDAELIAGYERWHAAGCVPPAVVASIRNAGIADMQIHRAGTRLVMVMETLPGFDPAAKASADAADPEIAAWERLMDGYQQPIACAAPGDKWTAAVPIFSLAEQP